MVTVSAPFARLAIPIRIVAKIIPRIDQSSVITHEWITQTCPINISAIVSITRVSSGVSRSSTVFDAAGSSCVFKVISDCLGLGPKDEPRVVVAELGVG